MRVLVVAVAAAFLSACAAIGPTSSPEFSKLLTAAVPHSEGEPRILGPGNWFPNTRGFAPLLSAMLARPSDPIPGAIAITDKSIVFAQWDDRASKFETMKKIELAEVDEATIDTFGLNRRLVIKRRDFSVDSFDFTKASGNLVDADKTEAAGKFVQSQLASKQQQ